MSIASRIEAIQDHLTDDYSVLTLAGADLTNVDKNIENLKPTWKERLLYFINNGTDEVWNNWNKVTGTGTTLTLNNTLEAPMSLVYKGNTLQNGTPTPDNPVPIQVVSGDNSIEVVGKNLFDYNDITTSANYTNNYDGTFTRNSNGSNILINVDNASVPYDKFSLKAGTYSVSFNITTTNAVNITSFFMCTRQSGTTSNISKTLNISIPANTTTHIKAENFVVSNDAEKVGFAGYLSASTGVVISNIQVEKNNQATEYQEYKGTTYPISLGVENLVDYYDVKGVGSRDGTGNVESGKTRIYKDILTISKPYSDGGAILKFYDTPLPSIKSGEYITISFIPTVSATGVVGIANYNGGGTNNIVGSQTFTANTRYSTTLEALSDYTKLGIFIQGATTTISLKDLQVEKGQKLNSYTPYGEAIEFSKIGDYQDIIFKSSGKNLFDGETELGAYDNNGNKSNNNNCRRTIDFIEVKSGTTYILSRNGSTFNCKYFYYDKNKNYISSQVLNSSFTTPDNCYYLNFFSDQLVSNYANLMLNEGTTASEYEPYGTGWYVKKEIGKVIYTGASSEIWGDIENGGGGNKRIPKTLPYDSKAIDSLRGTLLSNYFKYNNSYATDTVGSAFTTYALNNSKLFVYPPASITTTADFKTWLSTHNTIVYYVLNTPTYTLIEDSTLISQLEALKSKTGQTNITQENNDMPFELDVKALSQ